MFPMSDSNSNVGIIGLGIMGSAIASHLVARGNTVIGFDTDPERCQEAKSIGVAVKGSATEVGIDSKVVLTSLPSVNALNVTVDALLLQPCESVLLELSTLPLDAKLASHAQLAEAGIELLDCPLSGTGAQAVAGDISVYASGDQVVYESCLSVVKDFSRVSYYLGALGNGTKMKFVANLLVAIHNVATAEAIVLGIEAGLDPDTLCEVAGSGAGASRVLDLRGPMMVNEQYEPASMKLDVWQKDMALIRDFSENCGVKTPLFSASAPIYDAAIALGHGQRDTAAVRSVLQNMVHSV